MENSIIRNIGNYGVMKYMSYIVVVFLCTVLINMKQERALQWEERYKSYPYKLSMINPKPFERKGIRSVVKALTTEKVFLPRNLQKYKYPQRIDPVNWTFDTSHLKWTPQPKLPLGMNVAQLINVGAAAVLSNKSLSYVESVRPFIWFDSFEQCKVKFRRSWLCLIDSTPYNFKKSLPQIQDRIFGIGVGAIRVLSTQASVLQWILDSRRDFFKKMSNTLKVHESGWADSSRVTRSGFIGLKQHSQGKSISVHIRRGDSCFYMIKNIVDVANFKERFDSEGKYLRPCFHTALYVSAIEDICSSTECSGKIYVATDSHDVIQELSKYSQYNWMYTLQERKKIFHSDSVSTDGKDFIERRVYDWKRATKIKHAIGFFAELEFLKHGDVFIGTSSTVSRLHYLRMMSHRKTILPYYFLDHPLCISPSSEVLSRKEREELVISACFCWPDKTPPSKICNNFRSKKKSLHPPGS